MGVVREVDLPTGVVTLLFTDIEGSTRLLTEVGDVYSGVLVEHHRLLREVWSTHGGVEVGTEGDAFFVAFPDPVGAVRAATAAQRALAAQDWGHGVTLKVRMGVHTGRPKVRDGDYWGLDVHYAARLASAANGGQVLVSDATAAVVEAELEDLGEHALKDFPAPRRVFHLVVDGRASAEFPAPRTLRAGRTNLPAQLSSLVGREAELDQVRSALEQSSLVTLVGPGGVGKTRLALATAAQMLDGSGDGVWLVELAALSDPGLVAPETARVLGAAEQPGMSAIESLVESVRERTLLLVLDNCEHVVEAAAELVAALLAGCPGVSVLATSREPLGVPGERVFGVPPLSLPIGEDPGESDAVRLFVERARERRPEFAVDKTNAEAVVAVVRRLDGIPLALELAAARMKSLAIGELHARLDRSLRLLTGGSRAAPARQQTLQALIDWSYELLDERERTMLARLSVFAGGFELDAAEAVCTGDQIDELDVIELLGSLVDKSLVQVDDIGDRLRYRLLETVREYAAAKLAACGEQELTRTKAAHRDHYLALAETARDKRLGPEETVWLDRVDLEHDNVRAALAHCLEDPDPEPGLRLAAAASVARHDRGRSREAADSLLQHLNRPEAASATLVRANALMAAVTPVILALDDLRLAAKLAEEAVAIASAAGDDRLAARALGELSMTRYRLGRTDEAVELAEQGVALARQTGDSKLVGGLLLRLGNLQASAGRECRDTLAEAAVIARQHGDRQRLAAILQGLGLAALANDDAATARQHLEESRRIAHELNHFGLTLGGTLNLGFAAYIDDDHESAQALFTETLRTARDTFTGVVPYAILGLALAADSTHPERAAWLHGAVDRLITDADHPVEQLEARLQSQSRQRLRVHLGDAEFEAQITAGYTTPTDAVIATALQA